MKIEFDQEADALYIQFQPGKSKKSIKVKDGIILDVAEDGRIFGIEILAVSRKIPLSQIGHIDLDFPIAKKS